MDPIVIKSDNIKKGDVIPMKGENKYLHLQIIHSKGVVGFVDAIYFAYHRDEAGI